MGATILPRPVRRWKKNHDGRIADLGQRGLRLVRQRVAGAVRLLDGRRHRPRRLPGGRRTQNGSRSCRRTHDPRFAIVVGASKGGTHDLAFPIVGAAVCFPIRLAGVRFDLNVPPAPRRRRS
jgi:hypothetical protein